MLARIRAVSLVVLLLATVAARSQSPAPEAKPSPGSIKGHVTFGDKPAQGMIVMAMREDASADAFSYAMKPREFSKTMTDAEGDYLFASLAPGSYVVFPYPFAVTGSTDSKSKTDRRIKIEAGAVLDNVDFALQPGGVITGRATDAKGHPAIGQAVFIHSAEAGYRANKLSEELLFFMFFMGMNRTDDRGIYRLYGLPPGRYYVSLKSLPESGNGLFNLSFGREDDKETFHPGVTAKESATVVEVKEGSETRDIDIRLGLPTPMYKASGRIIDAETSKPVTATAARCRMTSSDNSSVNYRVAQGGAVNSTGEFQLDLLPTGKYLAYAVFDEDSNYYSESTPFEIDSRNIGGITIKIHRGQTVSGVVVFEGPTNSDPKVILPQLPIRASVSGNESGDWQNRFVKPAADGAFRLTGIHRGSMDFSLDNFYLKTPYTLLRVDRNGIRGNRYVEIAPGDNIDGLRIVVAEASGVIRGQIVSTDETPLPKERIVIVANRLGDSNNDHEQRAGVDANGGFKVTGLMAGEYELTVYVMEPDPVDTSKPRPKLSDAPVIGRQRATVTLDTEANVTLNVTGYKKNNDQ